MRINYYYSLYKQCYYRCDLSCHSYHLHFWEDVCEKKFKSVLKMFKQQMNKRGKNIFLLENSRDIADNKAEEHVAV